MLTDDTGCQISGHGQDQHSQIPRMRGLTGEEILNELRCIAEITGKSHRRPERHQNHQRMRAAHLGDFFGIPGLTLQTQSGRALTLQFVFDQDKKIRPQGLEAKIAAPGTADKTGDKEQEGCGDEQQHGEPEDILRIDDQVEDEESARFQIEHHCLVSGAVA